MTDSGASPEPDRLRWAALAVVLIAGFMDLLDVTIVNVTIPSILRDLGAEYAEIEWIIAAYSLAFSAVLITGGRLGDVYGRRRLFLIGVGGFTVASALCGLATGPAMLIGARFLQGTMAGLMAPQILSIVVSTFSRQERGIALGLWGGVLGSASAAGVILGGVLVQWDLAGLEWRPIFLVNVPVGLVAMVAAWFVIKESKSPNARKPDFIGMALAVTAVMMLVYPLTEGRSLGWPAWTFLLMGGSVLLLAVFVAYERRRTRTVGSPLVVLSLFRARTFSSGTVLLLFFGIALGGFFLVWTLYMQVGLGWTPLRAGLTASSFAAAAMLGAALSVQLLTPRFGRRVLMTGAILNAAGFAGYIWVATRYGTEIQSAEMLGPLAVAGIGFGLVISPLVDLILTDVPARDAGSASGLLNTTLQLSMAIGVALTGVVFFAQLDRDSARGVEAVTPSVRTQLTAVGVPPANQDEIIAGFRACVQERSAATDPTEVPASCRAGSALPGQPSASQVQGVLIRAGMQANAHNFSRTFTIILWYAAGILVLVFLAMFGLPRHARPRDLDAELLPTDGPDEPAVQQKAGPS
jgi:EmrB/QacA subfamily drug resistance transporter